LPGGGLTGAWGGEGNFEDYEADKVRRLGPDAVNPHRVTDKKLTR